MTTWDDICRVCSGPAEYDLFARIPNYLHGGSNEHLKWTQPINVLLQDATGIKVSADDGLPRRMCALCISYLKHASTFRTQFINNVLSLKAVEQLTKETCNKQLALSDKESLLITEQDLQIVQQQPTDPNVLLQHNPQEEDKVRKQLLDNNGDNSTVPKLSKEQMSQQMRYLNILFKKNSQTAMAARQAQVMPQDTYDQSFFYADESTTLSSSDETEQEPDGNSKLCMFSYKETNFEEDDIMNTAELKDAVEVLIPEDCKEKKCIACQRRFLVEASFEEHKQTCIELRFLQLIEDVNSLLVIRRNKAASPHEYIRRMIFCLRKACEWLKENCIDMLDMPDLVPNGNGNGNSHSNKQTSESDKSEVPEKVQSEAEEQEQTLLDANDKLKRFILNTKRRSESRGANLLTDENAEVADAADLLWPKPKIVANKSAINMENNILYEIERSLSRNSNQSHSTEPSKRTIRRPMSVLSSSSNITNNSFNYQTDLLSNENERSTFLMKLQDAAAATPPSTNRSSMSSTTATPLPLLNKDLFGASSSSNRNTPTTPLPLNFNFTARCSACDMVFESLVSLELHNAMYHNSGGSQVKQPQAQTAQMLPQTQPKVDDEERKKIIAMFENP